MFIDTHTHLLPAVDDGVIADFDYFAQLGGMVFRGAAGIFCTPHSWAMQNRLRPEDMTGRERVEKLFREKKATCPVPLYLGCELYWSKRPEENQRLLQGLKAGVLPTMNGTDYVLVEFDTEVQPPELVEAARLLQEANERMIVAHAERYPLLEKGFLERLKELGVLIQVSGEPETPEQAAAQKMLLKAQLADFLGSDNHGSLVRPSFIDAAQFDCLSAAYREELLWKNAVDFLGCIPPSGKM